MADYSLSVSGGGKRVTPNSLRATMTIVATVPILFVYPFLQKYFVKGLTLGGVKG
jgi:putative aldouronate transport system permease protein